jgi:hypothetical protein
VSQEELVGAYVAGEISRRTLIRRLVAGGLTVGAATAYAQLLSPKADAAERGTIAEYPRHTVRMKSTDLKRVLRRRAARVQLRTVFGDTGWEEAGFRVKLEIWHRGDRIGRRTLIAQGGRKTYQVKVRDTSSLEGLDEARVVVRAVHKVRNKAVRHVLARDNATLRA